MHEASGLLAVAPIVELPAVSRRLFWVWKAVSKQAVAFGVVQMNVGSTLPLQLHDVIPTPTPRRGLQTAPSMEASGQSFSCKSSRPCSMAIVSIYPCT